MSDELPKNFDQAIVDNANAQRELDQTVLSTLQTRRTVREMQQETTKLLLNLYGVDSEQELEDLLNDRVGTGVQDGQG